MNRDLHQQLLTENLAMLDYANDSGTSPPAIIARHLQTISEREPQETDPSFPSEIGLLTEIHNKLVELIHPATPRTILALSKKTTSLFRFRGTVRLVQHMRITMMLSLVSLIAFSLFEEVDGAQEAFSLDKNSGMNLLLNYLFLLSAASIGACFSALFTANGYIKNGTFDNTYESSYWTRYVLGLMAGIMMAILLPIDQLLDRSGSSAAHAAGVGFGPPLLAILGGLSVNFVYRLLDKLVKVMEASVKGDANDALATKEAQAQARLTEKANQISLGHAKQINDLQKALASGASKEDLAQALSQMQKKLTKGLDDRL